jgi:alpha-galactosidase
MNVTCVSRFNFAGTTVRFPLDAATGRIGMDMIPTSMLDQAKPRRDGLAGLPYIDAMPGAGNPPAFVIDPLAQVKIVGDPYPAGFAQGHTMRNSSSVDGFKYSRQHMECDGDMTTIVTDLKNGAGHRIKHCVSWHDRDEAAGICVTFYNDSGSPVTLEMLASFSLGGITPFDSADAPGRLRVHRFRSAWSAEGRLETRSIEQLHLERSWSGAGIFSERFGQVGSMPVRKWFPFVAVEDTVAGVVWGAQLAWAGSWQMEIFRQHDDVCISGGLADREFGHWMKTLAPGESLTTPPATAACVLGTLDDLCDRLTAVQQRAADTHPEIERDLPVVFNEWGTTWGDPRHEKVLAIARRLKGFGVKYLVIDAGWYKTDGLQWWNSQGDWIPSADLFPQGLEATAAGIREQGLIPGIWFEMEVAGRSSAAYQLTDHLLRRDGVPVTAGERRFWNLNDPWVVDYLSEKVIRLIERCGFGYLKVDYNDSIGIGCDDPDGVGEGLRKQICGIHRFIERIRGRLPGLVIENCSSGGHRLEPSMMSRTAMSSFSDAHELAEIPIIAANLHRLVLPRQSQIWAVLRRADSERRLAYSLAATFLGRMCLSGEFAELAQPQWDLVLSAQRIYRQAVPIIKDGISRRFGETGESWRYPKGWQAVVRTTAGADRALVVMHVFKGAPAQVEVPLKFEGWRVDESFPSATAVVFGSGICWRNPQDFSACVLLLSRD